MSFSENSSTAAADPVWGQRTSPGLRLRQGGQVGRFQIEQLLGTGGISEVWKAWDPVRQGPVVIKLLLPLLRGNNEELQRLQDSFLKVQGLQHQHICPLYDLVKDAELGSYLVMKYIEGPTLSLYRWQYLQTRSSFPLTEVVNLLRPIAQALDYAHVQGVAHRDIKPANIVVASDGSGPQLVDFGLAAEIQDCLSRITNGRTDMSGTKLYMPPEQWRGWLLDGRADQYSLAIVAHELLVGAPPFASVTDTASLRRCVLQEPVPSLALVSDAVNRILQKALSKEPMERFESCTAVIDGLVSADTAARCRNSRQMSSSKKRTTASRYRLVILAMSISLGVGAMAIFAPQRNSLSPDAADRRSDVATTKRTEPSPEKRTEFPEDRHKEPQPARSQPPQPAQASADPSPPKANLPGAVQPEVAAHRKAMELAREAAWASCSAAEAFRAMDEDLRAGQELFNQADQAAAEGRYDNARSLYTAANARFVEAGNNAKRREEEKLLLEEIESLKTRAKQVRETAAEQEAKTYAKGPWDEARRAFDQGEQAVVNRNFSAARQSFRLAEDHYRHAEAEAERWQSAQSTQREFDDALAALDRKEVERLGGDDLRKALREINDATEARDPVKIRLANQRGQEVLEAIRMKMVAPKSPPTKPVPTPDTHQFVPGSDRAMIEEKFLCATCGRLHTRSVWVARCARCGNYHR